jgi:hypothetical protein
LCRVATFVVIQKDFYWFLADGSTADATHATKPILPEFAVVSANDGRMVAAFVIVSKCNGIRYLV